MKRQKQLMMRRSHRVAMVVLFLAAGGAAREASLDELRAKALRENHPRLYAELVRRQVEVANQYYNEGDAEKAQATIAELVQNAERCRDAAIQTRKKLKDTEKTLYRASRRLEEVRRSLALDDRPPVEAAVDKIEAVRRELLNLMFAKESK